MISGGLVKMPVSGPVERLVIKNTPFEGLEDLCGLVRTHMDLTRVNPPSHSMPSFCFVESCYRSLLASHLVLKDAARNP